MSRKKKSETTPEQASGEPETAIVGANSTRIVVATEREAKKLTESLREAFGKFTAAWWEMGRRTKEALDRQVPEAMGLNPYEWMKSVFGDTVSVAKIQRSLRIARALTGIPDKKIELLTEGKAYLLTQLKEEERAEYFDQAVVATNDQFEQIVEERLQAYGHPPTEEKATISVRVAKSIAERWEEAESKVARLANLDIVLKPGLRGTVFEIIAQLINDTPDEVLTAETSGGGA